MSTELAQHSLPEEVVKILRRPIDKAALSQAPRGLTSIKSIYITERLNEAFGVGAWFVDDEVVQLEPPKVVRKGNDETVLPAMVVVKASMGLLDYPWFKAASYGGNNNADLGDAYKGAVSDAISKMCAMYLGIAADVYKGLEHHQPVQEVKRQSQPKPNGHTENMDAEPVFDENGDIVSLGSEPIKKAPSIAVSGEAAISEGKAKRFWAVALSAGKSKEEINKYLLGIGLNDIKNCPWKGKTYENAVQWAEGK